MLQKCKAKQYDKIFGLLTSRDGQPMFRLL